MVNRRRRIVARLLVGLLVLVSAVALTSQPGNAETGGYPYANIGGGSNADSQWFDDQGSWLSPYNYGYRNCTDFVAWKLDATNGFKLGGSIGHARDWGVWANTSPHKYPVDMTPAIGSIAWWDKNHGGGYGHVAYVIAISADGNTVTIEEYNWYANDVYDGKYHKRDIKRTAVSGYIHFKDGGGSGGAATTNLPDGQVVENLDTNPKFHYVAAGGRLFWYDRYNASHENAFMDQMRAKLSSGAQVRPMYNQEINRIEANRDDGGNFVPRSHMLPDNTFVYEYGSPDQSVIMYGLAFLLASIDEVQFLGGANKATMIPPGNVQHWQANGGNLPSIQHGRILKSAASPDYYEIQGGYLYHANNMTVVDCLSNGFKVQDGIPSGFQPVPLALLQTFLYYGRNAYALASCQMPEDVVFFGPGGAERWQITGDNGTYPYTRRRYASTLAMHCERGAAPRQVQISTGGVNHPQQGADIHCPNNTYLRLNQTGQVFQWWDGQLHYIQSQEMLNCLTQNHPEVVIGLDGSAFGAAPQGTWASCGFEGKLLRAPNGQVFHILNGQRHYVGNSQIVGCLGVRANAGQPIDVSYDTVNSFGLGSNAYCTYPPDIRFVRGDGQPEVWRVFQDGTRQHASGLCYPQTDPRYYVHVVPAGEVDGHGYAGVFEPTASACAGIA